MAGMFMRSGHPAAGQMRENMQEHFAQANNARQNNPAFEPSMVARQADRLRRRQMRPTIAGSAPESYGTSLGGG